MLWTDLIDLECNGFKLGDAVFFSFLCKFSVDLINVADYSLCKKGAMFLYPAEKEKEYTLLSVKSGAFKIICFNEKRLYSLFGFPNFIINDWGIL